jgi:hypothetical protein
MLSHSSNGFEPMTVLSLGKIPLNINVCLLRINPPYHVGILRILTCLDELSVFAT